MIMDLKVAVQKLKSIASLSLAGSWDNVGLLVQPPSLSKVTRMLLTNDLTESVMDEAESKEVNLILSYHPPIFKPLKSITTSHWKERIVGRCLEKRIAIFSPHTSYDSVKGGVNDWLIEAFGEGQISPIEQSFNKSKWDYSLSFTALPTLSLDIIANQLKDEFKAEIMPMKEGDCLKVLCTKGSFSSVLPFIESSEHISQPSVNISLLAEKIPVHGCGMGRLSRLMNSLSLSEAVQLVKEHLELPFVRLAIKQSGSLDSKISSVAVCAGSGASVLRGIKADLYLTGEMSHHEVLEATHSGTNVILTDHSNCERGFLKILQPKLQQIMPEVEILVSTEDSDPLKVI